MSTLLGIIDIIVKILGWIWFGSLLLVLLLGIFLGIRHLLFELYGLITWQERKPVYLWEGNSFFMDWLSFSTPDHYVWQKRETPKFIIKIKEYFKKHVSKNS